MLHTDVLSTPTTTEARADAAASVVRHAHASFAAVARSQHVSPREYLDLIVDELAEGPTANEFSAATVDIRSA